MDDVGDLDVGVDTGEPSTDCSGVAPGRGRRRPTPTSDFNLSIAAESDTADSGVGGVDIVGEGGGEGALASKSAAVTVTGLLSGNRPAGRQFPRSAGNVSFEPGELTH